MFHFTFSLCSRFCFEGLALNPDKSDAILVGTDAAACFHFHFIDFGSQAAGFKHNSLMIRQSIYGKNDFKNRSVLHKMPGRVFGCRNIHNMSIDR
jgi:hypothetical protein